MVVKTASKLMQKYRGRCLLRPVRADQSEQTDLFGSEVLKRQEFRQRANRGAAAMDSTMKIVYCVYLT